MVTSPAPASSDLHALSPATAGTTPGSSHAPVSFQSVYQSLPGGSEGAPVPPAPHSKAPASKKSKGTDDTLPAVATVALATDLSPQRPRASLALPAAPNEAGHFSASRQGATSGAAQSASGLASVREPSFNAQDLIATPTVPIVAPPQDTALRDSRQPAQDPSHGSAADSSPQRSLDPELIGKGLVASLATQNKNLAFSLRLLESKSAAPRTQAAAQPGTARTQPVTQSKNDEHPPASSAAVAANRTPSPANLAAELAASTVNPAWHDVSAPAHLAPSSDGQILEARQAANPSAVAALHEAQPVLPEAPRPNAAGEILLQLGGKDQAAAIRVSDRAGIVNVSVHASDPDLRSSLRSNLGELASQLTHQGWKTDVVKTALTRGETSQDSRQDGQRSSGQQQAPTPGERQPQRDRRANSGQWLAELEEQASGKPGGTN